MLVLPLPDPVAGDEDLPHTRLRSTAPNSLSTIFLTPSVFGCRSISTITCSWPSAWSGATCRGPFVMEKHSTPFVYSSGIACGTPAIRANAGAISRIRFPRLSPFAPYSSSAPISSGFTPRCRHFLKDDLRIQPGLREPALVEVCNIRDIRITGRHHAARSVHPQTCTRSPSSRSGLQHPASRSGQVRAAVRRPCA